jgi:hypothetical protein
MITFYRVKFPDDRFYVLGNKRSWAPHTAVFFGDKNLAEKISRRHGGKIEEDNSPDPGPLVWKIEDIQEVEVTELLKSAAQIAAREGLDKTQIWNIVDAALRPNIESKPPLDPLLALEQRVRKLEALVEILNADGNR